MKLIVTLCGLIGVLGLAGCEIHEHGHRGGTYDGYYRGYGHDSAPGYRYEHRHWDNDHGRWDNDRDWDHR